MDSTTLRWTTTQSGTCGRIRIRNTIQPIREILYFLQPKDDKLPASFTTTGSQKLFICSANQKEVPEYLQPMRNIHSGIVFHNREQEALGLTVTANRKEALDCFQPMRNIHPEMVFSNSHRNNLSFLCSNFFLLMTLNFLIKKNVIPKILLSVLLKSNYFSWGKRAILYVSYYLLSTLNYTL